MAASSNFGNMFSVVVSLSRCMHECFMAVMRPGLDRRVAVQLGLSEAECKLTAEGRAAVETNPAAN
jgi:hypothetical protein